MKVIISSAKVVTIHAKIVVLLRLLARHVHRLVLLVLRRVCAVMVTTMVEWPHALPVFIPVKPVQPIRHVRLAMVLCISER